MIYKCYNYLCAYFFEEKKCITGMTQSCTKDSRMRKIIKLQVRDISFAILNSIFLKIIFL